jgi:hypothetical protein
MTIRRRTRDAAARPWVAREDLALAAELPLLAAIALTLPEARWQAACRRLEEAKARLGWFDPGPVARTARASWGRGRDVRRAGLRARLGRGPQRASRADPERARSARLDAAARARGSAHVDDALAAGRGAVLWVAHFCFNALATKKALAGAGHRAWHVSRPSTASRSRAPASRRSTVCACAPSSVISPGAS